ncbi:MAG: DegV family protein [Anaerolineales bacterium]|nr:DegV family protein [Anaerolineales bacterium]
MSTIALITDTDSSIPLELAERYQIDQVPIIVLFGEESYKVAYEIDDTQLFERIDKEKKLPTTSAPSPGQFVEAYRSALDRGARTILCFTVSGEVSATYRAALTAREEFAKEDIEVIDTRSLSMGQGFPVLAAAEAIKTGATKQEAIQQALEVRDRTHLFAALPSLKYIAMSGRVGQLTAGIANILNIQPILSIRDGKLDLLERTRTRGKAWARTVELCVDAAAGHPVEKLAIIHVAALEEAKQFETLLRASLSCPQESIFAELTAGLSVHSGSGLVGASFVVGK